jgi:acyl-CoA synthetase (AMP-forming)/AMP-acid ligase II
LGVPDERLGEIPVALVEVLAPGTGAAELLARLGERLVPYKRPRRLNVVETIPRVANGKPDLVRCRLLADQLCQSTPSVKETVR